jgi:general secretion pathway protein D
MSIKRSSILLAIVLLAGTLWAGVVFAAMSAEEIGERKQEVIRESLQKLGQPTENAALLEAAGQADALLDITLDRGVRETRVTIVTTGEPAYESFPLNGRQRAVVDVYNTINFHSGDSYKLDEPSVIRSVRTSLFQLEPQFTSRVVLDLNKALDATVSQQGNKIEIVVAEDVEIPAPAPVAPEEPAPVAQVAPEPEEVAPVAPEPAEAPAIEVAKVEEPAEVSQEAAELQELEAKLAAAAAQLEESKVRVAELEKKLEADDPETEAELEELRKQLDVQKQAYAELKTSSDADVTKKLSELERELKTELEETAREAARIAEAQKAALAELEEKLAAEAAEKERLSMQLARSAEEAASSRKQVGNGLPPDLSDQRVSLNFKDASLISVLEILKRKANINLLAGREVTGKVTAMLDDVPLMKAMELVLRENGYGLVYEEGIYRVVPLELAEQMGVATATETFKLEYAVASEAMLVVKEIVTAKGKVVASDDVNILIVTDDPGNMPRIAEVIQEIDVEPTIVDTMTGTFRLSYLEAMPAATMLEKMVTKDVASVIADATTNTIVLTDTPANFQVVSDLIAVLDQKPDQVFIEVLMVDAVLSDGAEFGVEWIARAIRGPSSNLQEAVFETNLGNIGTLPLDAGIMTLGIIGGDVDISARIAAEVQSRDATILADPKILVVNNETANIEIVSEVPFQEITQSTQGPPVASTEFKDIGVTLDVTPRITHENTIILQVRPEESYISGVTEDGIPIEDSRRADTTIMLADGQTVVMGGLRNVSNIDSVTKVPWLGDIPLLGRLFRNTVTEQVNTELLLFLTVHVVKGAPPDLTPAERLKYEAIENVEIPDATRKIHQDTMKPWGKRTPFWMRRAREPKR